MDRRENSRVHADSHGEGDDGHDYEATGSAETPECETNVLKDVGEEFADEPTAQPIPVDPATALHHRLQVPEPPQRFFPRLLGASSVRHQLRDPGFKVEVDLFIEAPLQVPPEPVDVKDPLQPWSLHFSPSMETSRSESIARVLAAQDSNSLDSARRPFRVIS